jgi:hypothetical protein
LVFRLFTIPFTYQPGHPHTHTPRCRFTTVPSCLASSSSSQQ